MPINGEWKNPAIRRCDKKSAYPNWRAAEFVAQKVSMRTGELVIAYQCFDCNRFHIGHPDRSQIIVRGKPRISRQVEKTRDPKTLPIVCPNCGGNIPDERRQAAQMSGTPTVYCCRKCQQKGSRKARRAKREAAGTTNESRPGTGADAA